MLQAASSNPSIKAPPECSLADCGLLQAWALPEAPAANLGPIIFLLCPGVFDLVWQWRNVRQNPPFTDDFPVPRFIGDVPASHV